MRTRFTYDFIGRLQKLAESYCDDKPTKVKGTKGESSSANLTPMAAGDDNSPGPVPRNKRAADNQARGILSGPPGKFKTEGPSSWTRKPPTKPYKPPEAPKAPTLGKMSFVVAQRFAEKLAMTKIGPVSKTIPMGSLAEERDKDKAQAQLRQTI